MRRPLRLWFAAFLAGCGGGNEKACEMPTVNPVAQDCATVSREIWQIGPYPPSSENGLRVEIGGSRALFLSPFVEAQCADSIVSVAWSVDDASVATVVPKDPARRGSWVNGLVPGTTGVRARIAFSDGTVQETAPRAIEVVVSAPPTGSVVVAEGAVDLEPYNANGNSSADFRRFIPFTIPAGSRQADLSVNWSSPLDGFSFALFEGECSGGTAASCTAGLRFVSSSNANDVKPLTLSHRNPSPGIYTMRIDNLGPGAETARYEVRVTPN